METAETAHKLTISSESTIGELRSEVPDLKLLCNNLKYDNDALKVQSNKLKTYSRRDNIIINVIIKSKDESNVSCVKAVKLFVKQSLEISDIDVGNMYFVRCHRLKGTARQQTWPIIVIENWYGPRKLC